MKVAVAHLIPAPFTQQVARSLDEAGMLGAFFCTLVDQPDKNWQQLAETASKLIRFDLETDLRRRAVDSSEESPQPSAAGGAQDVMKTGMA